VKIITAGMTSVISAVPAIAANWKDVGIFSYTLMASIKNRMIP
jgi:uncharacterized membrane protein YuzA (DUF378 family)